ncbi:MAG: hypothetical protein GY737_25670 [Desulfobacteraceae bacterium]|nr:hypothetical protein [Desulfobacteraceae bacterium]
MAHLEFIWEQVPQYLNTEFKLSPARVQKFIYDHFEADQARLPGIFLSYGGEFGSTSKSFNALGIASIIAVC